MQTSWRTECWMSDSLARIMFKIYFKVFSGILLLFLELWKICHELFYERGIAVSEHTRKQNLPQTLSCVDRSFKEEFLQFCFSFSAWRYKRKWEIGLIFVSFPQQFYFMKELLEPSNPNLPLPILLSALQSLKAKNAITVELDWEVAVLAKKIGTTPPIQNDAYWWCLFR